MEKEAEKKVSEIEGSPFCDINYFTEAFLN